MDARAAARRQALRHALRPKHGYWEKLVLAARAALERATGRAAVRDAVPPMYPGALRLGEEEVEAAVAAVRDVLARKRLFRHWGPERSLLEPSRVAALELAFARRVGVPHAVATSTGTAALSCALVGLGVGPGDEVVVPSFAWYTVASAVLGTGALPVVAEVDDSLTLDPADVERKLSSYTRAVVCVHMRGAPCDMDALPRLAAERGLAVLEDCAQAVGGSWRGRALGSLGKAGVFSFQQNKIVTAGEGGMVTTRDAEVHRRALVWHDATAASRLRLPAEAWLPGQNHRMAELQGAVAGVQLERLDGLLAAMRANKRGLLERVSGDLAAAGATLRRLHDPEGDTGIALVFFLPDARRTGAVVRALVAQGVPASRLWRDLEHFPDDLGDLHVAAAWFPLLHRTGASERGEPWRSHPRTLPPEASACPRSLEWLRRAVHLDVSPELDERQLDQIALGIRKVLARHA